MSPGASRKPTGASAAVASAAARPPSPGPALASIAGCGVACGVVVPDGASPLQLSQPIAPSASTAEANSDKILLTS